MMCAKQQSRKHLDDTIRMQCKDAQSVRTRHRLVSVLTTKVTEVPVVLDSCKSVRRSVSLTPTSNFNTYVE